jgi:hypothetical protein
LEANSGQSLESPALLGVQVSIHIPWLALDALQIPGAVNDSQDLDAIDHDPVDDPVTLVDDFADFLGYIAGLRDFSADAWKIHQLVGGVENPPDELLGVDRRVFGDVMLLEIQRISVLTGFGRNPVMARIPEQQVTRLKTEVSIVRLVEAAGIELKKHGGSDLVGRCPFHDDRTPSLVVSPEKNLWHCLGACGVGGSVIDWVMRFHKVSFRHACELLLKDHPALRLGDGTPPAASEVRQAASPFTLEAGDQALLEQVTDFYHQTLLESPEALEYLDKRGLGIRN